MAIPALPDTQANRTAGGYRIYYLTAGTEDVFPTMAVGTDYPTVGTQWSEFPSHIDDDPEFEMAEEKEDFTPAFLQHRTDADLVQTGMQSVSFTVGETDISALKIGLGTALFSTAGTVSEVLSQPSVTNDYPMLHLCAICKGPSNTWIATDIVAARRTMAEVVSRGTGRRATLKFKFDVFGADDENIFSFGQTHRFREQIPA